MLKAQVEAAARLLKVGDDRELEKDDVLEGLTAVVTVRLHEPQFEGQTKEVLGTPAVARDRRRRSPPKALKEWLDSRSASVKPQPAWCSTRSSAR